MILLFMLYVYLLKSGGVRSAVEEFAEAQLDKMKFFEVNLSVDLHGVFIDCCWDLQICQGILWRRPTVKRAAAQGGRREGSCQHGGDQILRSHVDVQWAFGIGSSPSWNFLGAPRWERSSFGFSSVFLFWFFSLFLIFVSHMIFLCFSCVSQFDSPGAHLQRPSGRARGGLLRMATTAWSTRNGHSPESLSNLR